MQIIYTIYNVNLYFFVIYNTHSSMLKMDYFEVNLIQLKYIIDKSVGGACGVMVIVLEIGHGDASSNPGREWLHFT